ncbi:MAG TPA: zinc ribbon domain-containing protein [Telluria sp.]|jgi:hypothetical protein
MSLIACSSCGEKISKKAAACPKCGHPNPTANHLSGGSVLGGLFIAGLAIWWMASGHESATNRELDKAYGKVASDSVEQYQIAKRGGDKMQACVHAGLVAASYLQAKDESKYREWQSVERTDCKRAGVPK